MKGTIRAWLYDALALVALVAGVLSFGACLLGVS